MDASSLREVTPRRNAMSITTMAAIVIPAATIRIHRRASQGKGGHMDPWELGASQRLRHPRPTRWRIPKPVVLPSQLRLAAPWPKPSMLTRPLLETKAATPQRGGKRIGSLCGGQHEDGNADQGGSIGVRSATMNAC